ncbi:unnamed protein product, partial [Tilletia laevis]
GVRHKVAPKSLPGDPSESERVRDREWPEGGRASDNESVSTFEGAVGTEHKATAKLAEPSNVEGAGGVARERDTSTEDDPLTAKSDGRKTTKRLRTSRADGASSELTSAVESMGSRQLEAAAETLKQQQQHHEEALRQAERACELEQRKHKDLLSREDRRLDLQEAQAGQEAQRDARVAAVE